MKTYVWHFLLRWCNAVILKSEQPYYHLMTTVDVEVKAEAESKGEQEAGESSTVYDTCA